MHISGCIKFAPAPCHKSQLELTAAFFGIGRLVAGPLVVRAAALWLARRAEPGPARAAFGLALDRGDVDIARALVHAARVSLFGAGAPEARLGLAAQRVALSPSDVDVGSQPVLHAPQPAPGALPRCTRRGEVRDAFAAGLEASRVDKVDVAGPPVQSAAAGVRAALAEHRSPPAAGRHALPVDKAY